MEEIILAGMPLTQIKRILNEMRRDAAKTISDFGVLLRRSVNGLNATTSDKKRLEYADEILQLLKDMKTVSDISDIDFHYDDLFDDIGQSCRKFDSEEQDYTIFRRIDDVVKDMKHWEES